MKSGHKALGVLLVLCGLILNPIFLSLMFSNDGAITSNSILGAVFVLEFLIVLFGVAVYMFNSSLLSNFGVAMLSVLFTIAFTIGIDRFYGAFLMPETANLLYPSFSRAEHKTAEFDLDVHINNLGFRGPNATIAKKKKRVVVIGDSFTFGWGVELQQTWVHLLSEAYPEFEFLNLGQGGNHPGDYVQVAKRVVPQLKPDLVLVGILQGNDLHQLMRLVEHEAVAHKPIFEVVGIESHADRFQRYIRIVFPNLSQRYQPSVSIRETWKIEADKLLPNLTPAQSKKYHNTISPDIKKMFEAGLLNPSLLYESLLHPDMYTEASDTSNSLYKKGLVRLQDHLTEMLGICEVNESKLLVLDLPNRPYGLPKTLNSLEEMGYVINGCDSLEASMAVRVASKNIGLSPVQPKLNQHTEALFYKYDGHWNATGNRIFAQELIKTLEKDSTWKHFLTSSSF